MVNDKKQEKLVIGVVFFKNEHKNNEKLIKSINIAMKNSKLITDYYILIKSNDGDDLLSMTYENIIKIEDKNNVGFGKAHNSMMDLAFDDGASYYLCINPDGFLHPNAIDPLIAKCKQYDNKALVESIQFPSEHPKSYDPLTGETDWCSGACLLISKSIYNVTQGFDDLFFMYCEDVDLSWRARIMGFKTVLESKSLFFHSVIENKSSLMSRQMLLSARLLSHKYGAHEFTNFIEKELVSNGFYPDRIYLPSLPKIVPIYADSIVEFRQGLHFSLPRW